MERFSKRIQEKAADFKQAPVLTVAFGDSITQGVTAYQQLAPESVYHRLFQLRLQECFPLTTFSTINAGVSGSTATQALERLERDVISHHPDLVLVGFGANDALGGEVGKVDFANSLRTIVEQVHSRTEADIILLTPPLMADRRTDRIHPAHAEMAGEIIRAQISGDLDAYADIVRYVATETGTLLADVHRAWKELAGNGTDVVSWLSNGLNHPDERGHRLAADVIWWAVEPVLGGALVSKTNDKIPWR